MSVKTLLAAALLCLASSASAFPRTVFHDAQEHLSTTFSPISIPRLPVGEYRLTSTQNVVPPFSGLGACANVSWSDVNGSELVLVQLGAAATSLAATQYMFHVSSGGLSVVPGNTGVGGCGVPSSDYSLYFTLERLW